MLTRRDFRYNFFIFRVISALRILPLDCDEKKGTLKVLQSPWKRCISLGFFGLSIIHSCYIILRLFQVLMNPDTIVRHHLVFHVELLLVAMVHGWYLICFILYPGTFVAIFNIVFAGNELHGAMEASIPRKAHSRQELLALAMPTLITLAASFILCIFSYDRTMAFLLYSFLPQSYQTPFWFRVLFCEEILFLAVVASTGCIVLNAQLLFFEKITGSLKLLMSSGVVRTSMRAAEMSELEYAKLREIQLEVSLFNNINRFVTFSFKFFCIIMCTLNGYFMIAYFSADPIFGSLYYVAFGVLGTMYSIMYERAFAIPNMFKLAKSTVLLKAGNAVRVPGFKRKMEMKLRSMPAVGIQIGHFHTFERVATPVFVDFVLRNVVGLLLMHLNC